MIGGIHRSDFVTPVLLKPCKKTIFSRLYDENSRSFTKIYCSCGRFVDIDTRALKLKKALHKDIECAHCRNLRIAKELELDGSENDENSASEYF